jgi:hypothetical protein
MARLGFLVLQAGVEGLGPSMRALGDENPGPVWVGRSLRGSRTVLCACRRTLVYPDEDTVFAGAERRRINSLSRRFAWRHPPRESGCRRRVDDDCCDNALHDVQHGVQITLRWSEAAMRRGVTCFQKGLHCTALDGGDPASWNRPKVLPKVC